MYSSVKAQEKVLELLQEERNIDEVLVKIWK